MEPVSRSAGPAGPGPSAGPTIPHRARPGENAGRRKRRPWAWAAAGSRTSCWRARSCPARGHQRAVSARLLGERTRAYNRSDAAAAL